MALLGGSQPPGDQDTASITPITASGGLAVYLGRDPEAPLRLGKGNILPLPRSRPSETPCFKILLL